MGRASLFSLPIDLPPSERLRALQEKLLHCIESMKNGAAPDLSGVDVEVERLCGQVLELPKHEAQPMIDALQLLSDGFTELGSAMVEMKLNIQHELGELQARAKAHKAYGMRGTVQVAQAEKEDGE